MLKTKSYINQTLLIGKPYSMTWLAIHQKHVPTFSTLAFSIPAVRCHLFQSHIFSVLFVAISVFNRP